MYKRKTSINKRPKIQQVEGFKHMKKPVISFVATDRDDVFVPAKTLLIEAPLQKFPSLSKIS